MDCHFRILRGVPGPQLLRDDEEEDVTWGAAQWPPPAKGLILVQKGDGTSALW